MIIDFHTHVFPNKIAERTIQSLADRSQMTPYANGTAKQLLKEMEEGNVDVSVVLPVVTRPEQFSSILAFASQLNENCHTGAHRLLSFGGVHPKSSRYREELRELKKQGFLGIKLHPDYQDTYIDDMDYMHILEEASKLDLIVSVHAGVDVGLPHPVHCPPDRILKVIQQVRPTKLVLAHLGGWKCWEQVEKLLVGENVYMDTAVVPGVCPKEQFKRVIQNHGYKRILFATDSPWSGQKESVQAIRDLSLPEEEEQAILYKNALDLLGGEKYV